MKTRPTKVSKPANKTSAARAASPSTTPPLHHSTTPILAFENLQRTKRINRTLLKNITLSALAELGIQSWHLTFYLVDAKRMAEINETHMGHPGPTDVITFDYSDLETEDLKRGIRDNLKPETRNSKRQLFGEIFICVAIAASQSREFRTTWQSEIVRYIVHALLHLCGYDDLKPVARREMKRQENHLVRKLERDFTFSRIACAP